MARDGFKIRIDPRWQRHMRDAAHRNGVRPLTEDIADSARRFAPVDTGLMVSTIETEYPAEGTGRVWVGGRGQAHYWSTVEYGDPTNPRYPVQPFMRPALYQRRAT